MTNPTPNGEGNAVPPEAAAELLKVNKVAGLIGISPRTVYRLADAGKMPRPVKLGTLVRWRADELRDWVDGGCPSMSHKRKRGEK